MNPRFIESLAYEARAHGFAMIYFGNRLKKTSDNIMLLSSELKNIELDSLSANPMYKQMAAGLRDLILDQKVKAGTALPSERKLSDLIGASRVTIRKALRELIAEGILFSRPGSGTYIAQRRESDGAELVGFTADAKNRHERPASIWLLKAIALPTPEEANHLKIRSDEKVVRLGRVRLSNGSPLAIEYAAIPVKFLPSLDFVEDSLYAALKLCGKFPASGLQKLSADIATPTEAGLLSIDEGSAILRIERKTYLSDSRPVEYTCSAYRADRYVFATELHPNEENH